MSGARILYNALYPLALVGARVSSWFIPKMREAISGRDGYRARWDALGTSLTAAPVWFHVASVGEFEQARPVISALHRDHPGVPVMVTFSSPSGYHFARRREKSGDGAIHFIDYLPFDRARTMRMCLERAHPRLLVFVKFDLWPNLIWEARARNLPVALIDATLSPSSRRLSGAGRWFYSGLYHAMHPILAISAEDAARFARSAPGHTAIAVCGDTRFDRVMERWNQRARGVLPLPDDDALTFIAGSTWPPDEARLLPALTRLARELPNLRMVLVPHEPHPHQVTALRAWAAQSGLSVRATSEPVTDARVVIVDTVGVLAEAYAHAHVAFVGGAFSTGVHSVIEPAIAGLPVVFGPKHDNSFEAVQLIERGAATSVSNEEETYAALRRYLIDEAVRRGAGAAAIAYVRSQLGATEKCMAALAPYL
ncbi:MAG TPA: glycosyltransferase N-terminal domain-containing protein [Candidatus Krumholzibacteria bacterium]|nr:glycosyltransferase N-terminal domain-containing protein [Candidatus Krumholzibacteria bacterium]